MNNNQTQNTLCNGTLKQLYFKCIDLSKNNYVFTGRKGNDTITLNLRFDKDDIFHYTGLEYLPSIVSILNNKNNGDTFAKRKKTLGKMIKKGVFSENNFQNDDVVELNFPRSPSMVTGTTDKYSVYHRINSIIDLETLLNSAQIASSSWIFDGWDKKTSKIPADYVLSIPSTKRPDEQIYLFGVNDKTANNKNCKNIKIISVFPDLISLTRCKPKPYKVVSEDIISRGNKTQHIYIDPEYQKQSSKNSNVYIKVQKMQIYPNSVIPTAVGAAVIKAPTTPMTPPPFFDDLLKGFKSVWGKVKNTVSSLIEPPKPTNSHKSNSHTQKRKPTVSNKRTAHNNAAQRKRTLDKLSPQANKQIIDEEPAYISMSQLHNLELPEQEKKVPTMARTKQKNDIDL